MMKGFSQEFTLTSNFQYWFEYPKNESLDSLFINEKLMSYAITEREVNFTFNLEDSLLICKYADDSSVVEKYKILEYSSFLEGHVIIQCAIEDYEGQVYNVKSTISMETNNVDLGYTFSYNENFNRGGYYPRMSYVFH